MENIDFSEADLGSLQLQRCCLVNCRFDRAHCTDWRTWASDFIDCSFERANLKGAALGGGTEDRGNVFRSVNFRDTDFRVTEAGDADFVDCDFAGARIERIDFQSSGFVRCRFAGPIKDVIFWDRGFRSKKRQPNPMDEVDFGDAYLRDVEFRRLSLDRVIPPRHPDHLVLPRYRCVLERALEQLGTDESIRAKTLRAVLRNALKWAPDKPTLGILNKFDLVQEDAEPTALEFVESRVREAQAACSGN